MRSYSYTWGTTDALLTFGLAKLAMMLPPPSAAAHAATSAAQGLQRSKSAILVPRGASEVGIYNSVLPAARQGEHGGLTEFRNIVQRQMSPEELARDVDKTYAKGTVAPRRRRKPLQPAA